MIGFQRIFQALADGKIEYLVAGGVAVNLHGVERSTADLDLIVHLAEENLLKFIEEPLPFNELDQRKSIRRAFGIEIPILSIQDLIFLKKDTGRPKDQFDIDELKKLSEND